MSSTQYVIYHLRKVLSLINGSITTVPMNAFHSSTVHVPPYSIDGLWTNTGTCMHVPLRS
ncbi:predicted protein [Sclerotinia sclerotiorum 1980 UF-70]|uniref:Uncharacterized protein n=1 Tax=Sclerotinia sclerotiorum (strain ATCC 18683 / 1980 / Ss-1) TaxID=665079 RepID=A7EUP4_SCLS1|nr:predicted protein [Sclerotinia sclerotiorum 1980 UF-70]EDN93186.1 predicted protein [Sclerotinia sclerotiorum 1980 UF-70]